MISCLPQRIVSVTLSVEKSRGLRYPDLVTGKADLYNLSSTGRFAHFLTRRACLPGGQHNSVIDLGLCYINGARNEYAKVHPFRIQNLSSVHTARTSLLDDFAKSSLWLTTL